MHLTRPETNASVSLIYIAIWERQGVISPLDLHAHWQLHAVTYNELSVVVADTAMPSWSSTERWVVP